MIQPPARILLVQRACRRPILRGTPATNLKGVPRRASEAGDDPSGSTGQSIIPSGAPCSIPTQQGLRGARGGGVGASVGTVHPLRMARLVDKAALAACRTSKTQRGAALTATGDRRAAACSESGRIGGEGQLHTSAINLKIRQIWHLIVRDVERRESCFSTQ
jgi:hypothetical protein